MLSQQAFDALGPVFVRHGWVFFGPYRRGQGLSAQAGPYIGDEIDKAKRQGGMPAGATTMVHLVETDHLDDQLAGLAWLRKLTFVDPSVSPWPAIPSVESRRCSAPSARATVQPSTRLVARRVGPLRRNCKPR